MLEFGSLCETAKNYWYGLPEDFLSKGQKNTGGLRAPSPHRRNGYGSASLDLCWKTESQKNRG